jgi:carbamate kinase
VAERTVVALGGHALGGLDPPSTFEESIQKARAIARALAPLLASRQGLLLVHGNGPQVGVELLRGELARGRVPPLPLDACVAGTEGTMGHALALALREEIRGTGLELPLTCVFTSVVVDEGNCPLKPVGPVLTGKEARRYERDRGWRISADARGLRRAVPSPLPLRVLEADAIRLLLSAGHLVIAGGGGGIALAADASGGLHGLEAVVDKDRTATLLAIEIAASRIIHLTSVDAVYRDHGTPRETPLSLLHVTEARRLLEDGQFPEGNMGPKIEASLDFLAAGGERVLITAAERLDDALAERAGTRIVP